MAQLSDDCFAGGGPLMRASEALERLLGGLVAVTRPERVPLIEALDRILAEPVVAAMDVPGRDNSAVDGFAVYSLTCATCYPSRPTFHSCCIMIETNPIHARIADLRARVASLRGYL